MPLKRLFWIGLLLALLATLAFLVFGRLTGRFITGTVDYVVFRLVNVSGMSIFLARGLVILATIPFFWAVAKYTKGFLGYHRLHPSLRLYTNAYGIVIVVYVAAFFLAMYLSSRSSFFGMTTGETLKWCAETPEGIRVFDSPGVDPIYGVKLERCTPAQIVTLRSRQVGLSGATQLNIGDPSTFEFFDSLSGRPKAWYSRNSDGEFEVYDKPGRHPRTGEQLTPVDADVVRTLTIRYRERMSLREKEIREASLREKRQQQQEQQARDTAQRLERIGRYVNVGAGNPAVPSFVAMDEDGRSLPALAQQLASAIGGAASLFKPAFVQDGLFSRLFQGDSSQLEALELDKVASAVVLATVSYTGSTSVVAGQDVQKVQATITLRLYKMTSGHPSRSAVGSGTGVAFTRQEADSKALTAAVAKAVADLKSAL